VPCLFLDEAELQDDKEFYCPNCAPDKEEEFNHIRQKLKQRVQELSSRQKEFGGVTIDRDMFKEKKNANPYNYAKEFPPTLRDLGIRVDKKHKTLGDFKWDYKLMCKKLTEELKEDYESRIQMVEWELDEIAEEVLKEEQVQEDPESEPEPDHIEVDLDVVKKEKMELSDVQECGAICEYCAAKFSSTSIYTCKREHRVCHSCRTKNPGCVCPVCYSKYGDRKRLALDHTSALLFRVANATNFDVSKMGKGKRRKKPGPKSKVRDSTDDIMDPMIMNVWSCTDENTNTLNMDHVDIEGPIVKAEPHSDNEQEQEQVSMATVLTESCLSNQLLTLIDNNVIATDDPDIAEVNQSPHTSPLAQQPTNYNDPGDPLSYTSSVQPKLEPMEHEQLEGLDQVEVENFALSEQEISDHINSIREPVKISPVEKQIMVKRDEIERLTEAKKRGEDVDNLILQKRNEINHLRQQEERIVGSIEVMDPIQAMNYLEEEHNQTAINLGEPQESPWRNQAVCEPTPKVSPSKMASSWAKYRARAETINKLPVKRFQKETGKKVHTLQVAPDGSMQIAPVHGGTVQPHPLPTPSTTATQYSSVGTVTMKKYTKTPVLLPHELDNAVEYQPSDTDQYQVESTVQFPPSLEVNHQLKSTGSSVHYQKVGDNVYRKVSPVKVSQKTPYIHTGPTKPTPSVVQYPKPTPALVQYPKPTPAVVQYPKPTPAVIQYPKQTPAVVQPTKPAPAEVQQQRITPEPVYQEYYNPAETEQSYNPVAEQQQFYNPEEQQHQYFSPDEQQYYNPAEQQFYNPSEQQYSNTDENQQYYSGEYSDQGQYQMPELAQNMQYTDSSQVGFYNQEDVKYLSHPQPQRIPAASQKVSPVKSPSKTKISKVSPVETHPEAHTQYQAKSQPTYTIQYTKPNPFADPLLISPYKKQTSSTALSSPVPVQKPKQVTTQRPARIPSTVQRNVTIKYNQPNPDSLVQPQPISGLTTKQMPKPVTGPTTKQYLSSTTDPTTTPLAITIKYNQPGPAVAGGQTVTKSMLISPPNPAPPTQFSTVDPNRVVLESRGCTCESLTPRVREHVFQGTLQFSLHQSYQGTQLEWKPFLALYAATGPEMYQFQLGRAGHVFYVRGVTSLLANSGDRWKMRLNILGSTCEYNSVELEGMFTVVGESPVHPPSVLPSDILPDSTRKYVITVSQ